LVLLGLVGPKVRPRGVADGQQVDSPVPLPVVMSDGGTQEDRFRVRKGLQAGREPR
jgi:hypothetical protein